MLKVRTSFTHVVTNSDAKPRAVGGAEFDFSYIAADKATLDRTQQPSVAFEILDGTCLTVTTQRARQSMVRGDRYLVPVKACSHTHLPKH